MKVLLSLQHQHYICSTLYKSNKVLRHKETSSTDTDLRDQWEKLETKDRQRSLGLSGLKRKWGQRTSIGKTVGPDDVVMETSGRKGRGVSDYIIKHNPEEWEKIYENGEGNQLCCSNNSSTDVMLLWAVLRLVQTQLTNRWSKRISRCSPREPRTNNRLHVEWTVRSPRSWCEVRGYVQRHHQVKHSISWNVPTNVCTK